MFNLFENEILNFYKKSMTMWALAFKYMWIRFISFMVIQVFIFLCSIGYLLWKMGSENIVNVKYIFWFFILEFFWFLGFHFFVVKPAKKNFLKRYNIKLSDEEWEFFRCLLLKEFLIYKQVLFIQKPYIERNKGTLDFCIDKLEKNLERRKKGRFLNIFSSYSAIFISLVIPAWAAFNNWYYTQYHAKDSNPLSLESAITYLGNVFVIIVVIIVLFVFLKHMFIEDLFRWGDQRIYYVVEMLQSVKFSLEHPYYLREFEKKSDIKACCRKLINEYESDKIKSNSGSRYIKVFGKYVNSMIGDALSKWIK